MQPLVFSCECSPILNGYTLKDVKPDKEGFFPTVVGVIGIPTRGLVMYEPQSYVDAMADSSQRFNVCLRDGNLCGEYGHPVVEKKEDIPRLFRIDEHYKSHYFKKIWLDSPTTFDGHTVQFVRALVKPTGPYGEVLEKELRDPYHNTAWSLRSLCLPMGKDKATGIEHRKVQVIVTFDAVHAPGFDCTSKRYVGGMESYQINVGKDDLEYTVDYYHKQSRESLSMITHKDLMKLFPEKHVHINGNHVATQIIGNRMFMDTAGNVCDAASLIY